MAIKVNSGGTQRSALKTGLCQMRVIAVNPTLDEYRNKLNIQLEKEPEYFSVGPTRLNPNGLVRKTRVEFHLQSVDDTTLTARLSLFLAWETVNDLYMNKYARFSKDLGELRKTDPDAWQCLEGEVDLMLFLEALMNSKRGEEFSLDYREDLFYHSDVQELTELLQQANDAGNTVQVLLGVQPHATKEGEYYQTAYKKVLPSWMTNVDQLFNDYKKMVLSLEAKGKKMTIDYGPIQVRYDKPVASDFVLRTFVPGAIQESSSSTSTNTVASASMANVLPPPPVRRNGTSAPSSASNNSSRANAHPMQRQQIGEDDDMPF